MFFSDLLPQIDARWHAAFVRFIETGEASASFLNYLDSDARCQKVMERLLAAQVKAFHPFMTAMGTMPAAKRRQDLAGKPSQSRRRASAIRRRGRANARP
jgi:hypothetical protein